MSVHAHGGCKHTRAEAPGQPSCKTLDTMPWNLLMNNGWKCMSKVGTSSSAYRPFDPPPPPPQPWTKIQ